MAIIFYRTSEVPYGCFSNFSLRPIKIDGKEWPTSEHFFQAYKFITTDPEYAETIRNTSRPHDVADLGRDRNYPLRHDWEDVKDDVMRIAVATKFSQHEDIQKILLNTGDETIIEATTKDNYWGEGTKKNGKNMLGIILEEVRDCLCGQQPFEDHWDEEFLKAEESRSHIVEDNTANAYCSAFRSSPLGLYLADSWSIVDPGKLE
ncbi:MAG: NADAR family protein [Candidatus Woesearchaeota archaeon]